MQMDVQVRVGALKFFVATATISQNCLYMYINTCVAAHNAIFVRRDIGNTPTWNVPRMCDSACGIDQVRTSSRDLDAFSKIETF